MTRRSTRRYTPSWRRRWSESPRRPSSMRSANTNQGSWPSSKDSFESSTSVLLEVLAALEDLLDLVVDLVKPNVISEDTGWTRRYTPIDSMLFKNSTSK